MCQSLFTQQTLLTVSWMYKTLSSECFSMCVCLCKSTLYVGSAICPSVEQTHNPIAAGYLAIRWISKLCSKWAELEQVCWVKWEMFVCPKPSKTTAIAIIFLSALYWFPQLFVSIPVFFACTLIGWFILCYTSINNIYFSKRIQSLSSLTFCTRYWDGCSSSEALAVITLPCPGSHSQCRLCGKLVKLCL